MSCTEVGTGWKTRERKTRRNMTQDYEEKLNGEWLLFLGRGRAGGG